MDFDPRITSDGSDGAEHGWSCNFNFGHGHDVIDDDAQAEKCCMQALRLLIAKADAEIHDLEDELAILRCELKWAESDKQRDPYEVCCAAFKRKIDYLTSSIQSLRNGNVSSRNAMNEALENQGSAERIYDIINALISTNFSEPDEQEVPNEKNLVVDSNSLITDTDFRQPTSLETSMEVDQQKPALERQEKPEGPELTSEESCSDVLRYATEDSKEDRYMAKSDDEGNREAEFDVYLCTSEGKSGCLTLKPFITPTHLQASISEGNSKSDASRHVVSEECGTRPKIGESGSPPLSTKEIVKTEESDYDINVQHVAVTPFFGLQDHEIDDPLEAHLKVTENQSESVVDSPITYGRKKTSSSLILKAQGQKVQRNVQSDLGIVKQTTPSLPGKPLGKIGVRKSPSNAEESGQLSSKVEGRFPFRPETNKQRNVGIEEDRVHANTSRKRRHMQGGRRDSAGIQPPVDSTSKGEVLGALGRLTPKLHNESPESPNLAEVQSSVLGSDSADSKAVGSKNAVMRDPQRTKSPVIDFENVRLKLSQDPDFLTKLKVADLKEIAKHYNVRRVSKLKKEQIAEELAKQLGSA